MDIFNELVSKGIFLVPIVMALVEYIKRFGVEGYWLMGACMTIGLMIGVPFAYFTLLPVDGLQWFVVAVFGLALGLVASGLYDMGTSIARKDQP